MQMIFGCFLSFLIMRDDDFLPIVMQVQDYRQMKENVNSQQESSRHQIITQLLCKNMTNNRKNPNQIELIDSVRDRQS